LFGFEEDEFESIFANAWKARFQPSAPVPTVVPTSERL
jgi:hypothetical protein